MDVCHHESVVVRLPCMLYKYKYSEPECMSPKLLTVLEIFVFDSIERQEDLFDIRMGLEQSVNKTFDIINHAQNLQTSQYSQSQYMHTKHISAGYAS